jgi:hypothetical protein
MDAHNGKVRFLTALYTGSVRDLTLLITRYSPSSLRLGRVRRVAQQLK